MADAREPTCECAEPEAASATSASLTAVPMSSPARNGRSWKIPSCASTGRRSPASSG
ncbi:hypothetical protein ACFPRL_16780 [Pseudoclavibacter helvolus]